jgi:hypothetical protein
VNEIFVFKTFAHTLFSLAQPQILREYPKISKGLFGDRLFFARPFSASAFQNLVSNKADSHGFWDRVTVCHID